MSLPSLPTPAEMAAMLTEIASKREEADEYFAEVNRLQRDAEHRVVVYRVRPWRERYPACSNCGVSFEVEPSLFLDGRALCNACFFSMLSAE